MKGLHRVAYDGWLHDLVLFYEGPDVLCHGCVVVALGVSRVAMVAEVLRKTSAS